MGKRNCWNWKKITANQLCSKKEENYESTDSVYLNFSETDLPNFGHEENTLIIREFQKACEHMDRYGANKKKIVINAKNLNRTEIGVSMRIVIHNCTGLNDLILMFFEQGFSSDMEESLPYIINTRIHTT